MPSNLKFSYYLYDTKTPVDSSHPAWQQPLPMSRHCTGEIDGLSLSHEDYFLAIRRFLEMDDFDLLTRALGRRLQKKVTLPDIGEIGVCLAKHGEFYHPARLEVSVGQQSAGFVLNVAISDNGIQTLHEEYQTLKRLNDEFTPSFIPQVYGFGGIETPGNRKIPLFLGEWLEGYHEFHISADPAGDARPIRIWDGDPNRALLSTDQQTDIYRQAARILTYYYNVQTLEQIFAFHHAAGDFIVRVENGAIDLKLITVRRYGSLLRNQDHLENGSMDVETMLQALLLFFLGLSIRMRLDRIDGVGDIVWADPLAVAATLEGFFEGLMLKPKIPSFPDTIDRCFAYFLSLASGDDIGDMCRSVVQSMDPGDPEVDFIKQNLDEHIASMNRSIKQFFSPS